MAFVVNTPAWAQLEADAASIPVEPEVWLVEDHGPEVRVRLDENRRLDDGDRLARKLGLVHVVDGRHESLVEIVDAEGDGFAVLVAVQQRVVREGDVGNVGAEGVPLLPEAQLRAVAPTDANPSVTARTEGKHHKHSYRCFSHSWSASWIDSLMRERKQLDTAGWSETRTLGSVDTRRTVHKSPESTRASN